MKGINVPGVAELLDENSIGPGSCVAEDMIVVQRSSKFWGCTTLFEKVLSFGGVFNMQQKNKFRARQD